MIFLALLVQAGMAPADFDRMKRAIPACLDQSYLKAIDALPEKDRREAEIICLAFTLGEDQGRLVKPDDISEKAWRDGQVQRVLRTLDGLKALGPEVREINKAFDVPRR